MGAEPNADGEGADALVAASRSDWTGALLWMSAFFLMLWLAGALLAVPAFALMYLLIVSRQTIVASGSSTPDFAT